MNKEEFAYLAGIIDGEGSIVLHRDPKSRKIWGDMTVYNSPEELISWIQKRFGGRIYHTWTREDSISTKPCFMLRWNGKDAGKLLPKLLPYLIIKKQKALALYDLSSTKQVCGRGYEARKLKREIGQVIYNSFKQGGS